MNKNNGFDTLEVTHSGSGHNAQLQLHLNCKHK